MSQPQVIIDEARSINSSLQRVKQSVKVGVLQAESASFVLKQDGELISETVDEHAYGLRGALLTTKHRLKALKFAELREKYTIYISLGCFICVVLYILLKRTRVLSLLRILIYLWWIDNESLVARSSLGDTASTGEL